jgi:hypothetical protein
LTEAVPPLVTLHLWRVPRRAVPKAVARLAVDRGRARRTDGVRFAKMLGTGDGRTFTVRDADPTRWAMLTTWATDRANSPVARSWSRIAEETFRVDLRPLVSRGSWSGRQPFGDPQPRRTTGPVAAVTRARLAVRRAPSFWSAVPPVSAVLQRSPGLLTAVGIGEAPVGLQGTFSLWSSGDALRDFAHREAAHTDVIARTQTEGWYAEELFARFEVLGSEGTVDGRDPLA